MPSTSSLPTDPRRPLKTVLYSAYFVLALGYLLYSSFTKTGLCGWLIDLQIRWFGSASERVTLILATLLLLLPLLLFVSRFDRRGLAAAAPPAVGPDGRPRAGASFRTLAWIAAVPALLAVPAYFWLSHQATANAQEPVHQLDFINQPTAPVPARAKFAVLHAVFQAEYQYVLEETRYGKVARTNRYVPLTGPEWRPGQPVRIVYDTSTGVYFDEKNQQTFVYDQTSAFPGTFTGELHVGTLPTVARTAFEQQGLRLAEPVYVLENQYFTNGRPMDTDAGTYHLVLWLGLIFSAAILLGGGIGLAIRRRRGLA
ncbi:hypothetical protein [Hymenobacter weizhouensis]|uniref:hypothetical protein n=1 Tax=Hymenobacter sp. YIM 151500-1 TaxID=2987689 RepID=UPI0022263FD4|nr:hypothetical protein [Hymenobacter sp. YIM 151500-1]UYZ63057.1 hypothetical protein OIS53_18940 [Hymenobacter sp. YIM 151500-1]